MARYLEQVDGGDKIIRTIVGFYANADEMTNAGGGQSSYTILDVDGNAEDVEQIKKQLVTINEIIGEGIADTTLTAAINDINNRIGEGFTAEHTIADALSALRTELIAALTISLDVAGTPTSGFLKTYILSQGSTEIGRIDIPKDLVVTSGSLVHGTWEDDEFTEDPQGPDTALKLVIANQEDPVYINTKDLVDYYTAGDGIEIDNTHNTIALKLDENGEPFLTVGVDGLKLDGVQIAIAQAIEAAKLDGSDGISIASNKVKAVAAKFSASALKNPIEVDEDGIKFASLLDCGFFDDITAVASTAEEINAITDPQDTDVFINGDEAFGAAKGKTFKNIEASDINAASETSLVANESITLDNVEVTGDKGASNAFILLNSPSVEISNATVADGSKAYNVFEQTGSGKKLGSFSASNVKVDDVALKHNVFNVYRLENDAVINISDVNLNLNVNNSNALRLANYKNATGVTVNFENVAWTYENTPNVESADFGWAGLIIYQPAGADVALGGDLSKVQTWAFNFKNCKYNGAKVTANNFGEKNQVFYLYNIGGSGAITDPVANGLTLNFA